LYCQYIRREDKEEDKEEEETALLFISELITELTRQEGKEEVYNAYYRKRITSKKNSPAYYGR
jgi:hypothetical protein